MAEYQGAPQRFLCHGVCLTFPLDALPPGKFPILENLRSYIEGTLEPREGTQLVGTTPGATDVHTVDRLNDETPFNGGTPSVRVVGAGGTLYRGAPTVGAPLTAIDSGYSGDPLATLPAQPIGTPQPWLYVADRLRQRKINVNGLNYGVGLAPPLNPPTAVLAAPHVKVIESFEYPAGTQPWLSAGTVASAPVQVSRVNTTISAILYDQGVTGNVLVGLTSMNGVGRGMLLVIGNAEQTLVQDVKIAIVSSTIDAILYDNGVAPGLCTIQPTGSLGTGSIQIPTWDQMRRRRPPGSPDIAVPRGTSGTPPPIESDDAQQYRQLDFPVDCLVRLDASGAHDEYVRILSVAIGRDNIMSFRCQTTHVHEPGEAIQGVAAIRCYLAATFAVGATVVSKAVRNVLTATANDIEHGETIVGGIRSGEPFFTLLPTDPTDTTGPGGGPGVNHVDVVAAAKAELIAEGASLVGPCGSLAIVIRTAEKLAGEGAGLLEKTTGNQCDGKSVDHICYPNGATYDILQDSGHIDFPLVEAANIPRWALTGYVDNSRYIPVGNNPVPDPVPPPEDPFAAVTALDLSVIVDRPTLPDDEFHVSLSVDKLWAVKEIRIYFDIDAEVNDYTRNVYYYAFGENDLLEAVQSFNATDTSTVIDQTQETAVPRTPVRRRYPYTRGQLALGNAQWMELRWKFKDMIHVGTDPTRTLAHVKGMEILLQVVSHDPELEEPVGIGPITVTYDSFWLSGSFGPDVGRIGDPYVYTYRYRSAATGARSRIGPETRAGVIPRRQQVRLQGSPSTNPEVDKIDWYRRGGSLGPTWAYVGSSENVTTPFLDDYPDDGLVKEPPPEDDFQPWPTQDLPREGTCNVAGSAVQWVSGDAFDSRWAPRGTLISINGIPYTLYQQPSSPSFLHLIECAGAQTGVTFELRAAVLMGANLPTLWGPFEGFYFAVGDPTNPGQLNWSKGNDPDLTSDQNTLYVTSPSTPLMNGFVWDNANYVFSTDQLYRILPDFSSPNRFTVNVLPCGRGLFARWAFCLTPVGVAFVTNDGICLTNAGTPAKSLTDTDLYPLFPHESVPGIAVHGLEPPDMTQPRYLRLGYGDGYIYFDYRTAAGLSRTLVYDMKGDRWLPDQYPVGINAHAWESGAAVHDVLLARRNGTIAHYVTGLGDDGAPIAYRFRPGLVDGGDPRKEKLIGDLVLDFDPAGGPGATVVPGYDSFKTTAPATTVGAGQTGRETYIIDLNDGRGLLAQNVGIDVTGTALVNPLFYLWAPSIIPKADTTAKRATDWDDAGYFGAKFMQGVLVEADTGGVPRTVRVEYDGGQLGTVITVNGTAGELQSAHSFATPFIAHLLRMLPTDNGEWLHYRHRWVWEPSPELAAYWITQPTTHDFPGYGHVERVLIAHQSLVDFDLIVTADGKPQTYRIPASAHAFVKTEILQVPNKGKVYQYALRAVDGSENMRIFLKDCEVRAKPWGHPDPYQILRPFGDLSREFGGARI